MLAQRVQIGLIFLPHFHLLHRFHRLSFDLSHFLIIFVPLFSPLCTRKYRLDFVTQTAATVTYCTTTAKATLEYLAETVSFETYHVDEESHQQEEKGKGQPNYQLYFEISVEVILALVDASPI